MKGSGRSADSGSDSLPLAVWQFNLYRLIAFAAVKEFHKAFGMRTRQSICARKARYRTETEALLAAGRADFPLRPYCCDRCRQFHLTSRTKGKWMPKPVE